MFAKRAVSLFVPGLALLLAACGDDSTGPTLSPPSLDSIAPSYGTVGTEIRIHGSAFQDSVTVFFGDRQSTRVDRDGEAVYAFAPEGLTAGTSYDVKVVNRDGSSDTLVAAFEVVAPSVSRVNGVSRPTGLVGMTVILEGDAFGDLVGQGKVFFRGSAGEAIEAVVVDSAQDWTNRFVVTTVPQGTADESEIWIETATGQSNRIAFSLIASGTFSPSLINWTKTTSLPQPLQGLGAVFVPVEDGAAPANYVFVLGGADSVRAATAAVYRAQVEQSGALGAWNTTLAQLPSARAYHATVAATAYTAALDTTTTAAYLYVIGGKDASGATVNTVEYARVNLDGTVGQWQSAPALPVALHAPSAAMFRGYVYVAGGADAVNAAVTNAYRAPVNADGSLGAWEAMPALPNPSSHFSLVNFGPFLYAVGAETGTVDPVRATLSGTETANVHLGRISLRTGALSAAGWSPLVTMAKARSKHSTIFAGGALLVSSGVYSGQPGSSENTYAPINSDGTLASWNGATGAETIAAELTYSLYNQAMVTFIDAAGQGHVLVLGGADRANEGRASAAVLYY